MWIPSSVSLNKALAPVAMFWGIIALGDQIKGEMISGLREESWEAVSAVVSNFTFSLYPDLVFMTVLGTLRGKCGSDTDYIRNIGYLTQAGNKG